MGSSWRRLSRAPDVAFGAWAQLGHVAAQHSVAIHHLWPSRVTCVAPPGLGQRCHSSSQQAGNQAAEAAARADSTTGRSWEDLRDALVARKQAAASTSPPSRRDTSGSSSSSSKATAARDRSRAAALLQPKQQLRGDLLAVLQKHAGVKALPQVVDTPVALPATTAAAPTAPALPWHISEAPQPEQQQQQHQQHGSAPGSLLGTNLPAPLAALLQRLHTLVLTDDARSAAELDGVLDQLVQELGEDAASAGQLLEEAAWQQLCSRLVALGHYHRAFWSLLLRHAAAAPAGTVPPALQLHLLDASLRFGHADWAFCSSTLAQLAQLLDPGAQLSLQPVQALLAKWSRLEGAASAYSSTQLIRALQDVASSSAPWLPGGQQQQLSGAISSVGGGMIGGWPSSAGRDVAAPLLQQACAFISVAVLQVVAQAKGWEAAAAMLDAHTLCLLLTTSLGLLARESPGAVEACLHALTQQQQEQLRCPQLLDAAYAITLQLQAVAPQVAATASFASLRHAFTAMLVRRLSVEAPGSGELTLQRALGLAALCSAAAQDDSSLSPRRLLQALPHSVLGALATHVAQHLEELSPPELLLVMECLAGSSQAASLSRDPAVAALLDGVASVLGRAQRAQQVSGSLWPKFAQAFARLRYGNIKAFAALAQRMSATSRSGSEQGKRLVQLVDNAASISRTYPAAFTDAYRSILSHQFQSVPLPSLLALLARTAGMNPLPVDLFSRLCEELCMHVRALDTQQAVSVVQSLAAAALPHALLIKGVTANVKERIAAFSALQLAQILAAMAQMQAADVKLVTILARHAQLRLLQEGSAAKAKAANGDVVEGLHGRVLYEGGGKAAAPAGAGGSPAASVADIIGISQTSSSSRVGDTSGHHKQVSQALAVAAAALPLPELVALVKHLPSIFDDATGDGKGTRGRCEATIAVARRLRS